SPWDIAAASLMITEAGGLIGNFTGESDFMYQREVVAGNPKVYGQMVGILAPYTRVIKEGKEGAATAHHGAAAPTPEEALIATAAAEAPAAAPKKKPPVRIRKADLPGNN
ncbi:MAG: inositol monophosphatase, partial [Cytophagales bacterium]|nr:inositol monophosphatase [Rhizobacter sp.]